MSISARAFQRVLICKIWLRYSRERAYLTSLILIRPWSFNFSRALPPPRHPSSWRGMRMISFNVRLLSLAQIILKSAGTMSHLLSRSTFLVALMQDHFDCSLVETWSPVVLTPDLLRMGRSKSAGAQPVAHPAAKKMLRKNMYLRSQGAFSQRNIRQLLPKSILEVSFSAVSKPIFTSKNNYSCCSIF